MKKRRIEDAPPSLLINHISKMFNDRMRQKSEAAGISEGWRKILFHLKHNEQMTQLDLAKRTHLSAPAVSVTLQKMEGAGLVSRRPDPKDQRAILVCLTEEGRAADRKVIRLIQETERELLDGISEQELSAIRPILLRMYQNFAGGAEK